MDHCDAENQESAAISARGNTISLLSSSIAEMAVAFANGVQKSIASAGSNAGLLLFIFNSIVLQMVLGQDHVIARFSPIYWALVLPAIIIPSWSAREIIKVFCGPGIALFAFFVCAGSFHLARGDIQAVAQLFLLVWVVAWCACDSLRLTTADLVKLFVGSLVLGILLALFTDINPWGLLPGRSLPDYGIWRVSFFPHVANSGVLCLIALMFLTREGSEANFHKVILALCVYFILFGFVRTVLVASALYLFLRSIFRVARTASPAFLFGVSVAVTIGSIL